MVSIRPQVLAQLKRGPRSPEQLRKAITEIESEKQLANCLYNLRKAGEIRRLDDGRYELGVEKGFAATRPKVSAREGAAANPTPRDPILAAPADPMETCERCSAPLIHGQPCFCTKRTASTVPATVGQGGREADAWNNLQAREQRALLEKAAADTQDALDEYLASIADPKILKPLRAARDATRAALAAIDFLEAIHA